MQLDEATHLHKKMAYVQLIAEMSLMANFKPDDLKLAMSLIVDLTIDDSDNNQKYDIFYAVD
ncbi:hypothetical protein [Nissabacter sp. SGAir0207]|uniref:hypothetical protein n=1 Tax=Nissabacter sp. SGAir0207 TaxID=2126321 RepID=UPI0010CD0990|nr:hypothetical protein [Nissabacter sp. SGAir0207]QCR37034.1 hypothetical protein C1N62_13540 [Nissabacter sp. SGAir0207]